MTKLLALGLSLLSFAGAHHHHKHHHRYWWPPTVSCQIGTLEKGGVFRGTLGIVCEGVPAGWHNIPPPPMGGPSTNVGPLPPTATCGPRYCDSGKPVFKDHSASWS